jgi:DNA-binding protein HU-beta
MSLNKTELVAKIAAETGQSQATVGAVLDGFFNTVAGTVAKGGKVSIPGWIAFESANTSARTGRNPQTGATINIPAGKRVKVSVGSKLKAAVK